MRCMTRAMTPPGVRPRCRSRSSCPLSGALSQKLAFGCQEVKEGLAFVGLGPGQGEGDGQALKGADQVQAQAPEEAAVAGAVAVFGPACQVGALYGLAGAAAF